MWSCTATAPSPCTKAPRGRKSSRLQRVALGYRALALTDHDSLAGAMLFAQAAKELGLQAIIGAEITLEASTPPAEPGGNVMKLRDSSRSIPGSAGQDAFRGNVRAPRVETRGIEIQTHHLTLLCETPRGYANLSRLLSRANLGSPRGEPRVRFEWLAEHAEGLIALSGCRKGEVAAPGRAAASCAKREKLRPAIETSSAQRTTSSSCRTTWSTRTRRVTKRLVALARDLGLGIVATNNVHYAVREQHRLHDVLMAVRHHTNLEEARPHLRANAEFYLKPPAEMERLFADLPEAIENTARIAERCRSFDLTRDLTYEFPDYDSGDGRNADEFLRDESLPAGEGALRDASPASLPENVQARLDKELALIKSSRRAGFFLRLWDILRYAHDNELPVRGRGSSVGSLVCFLLGLSGIDPIKYDLAVERFLSEDRPESDVPDVDLDFGREARDRMFSTSSRPTRPSTPPWSAPSSSTASASAIRDVGKALGLPESQIDQIAKRMHSRFAQGLRYEMSQMPEFAHRMQFPIWQDFIDAGGADRRAAATPQPALRRHHHLHHPHGRAGADRERRRWTGRYICQWDKDSVADAGFIKLDFLGYPSLDQLNRGLRYVRERYGREVEPRRTSTSPTRRSTR